MSSHIDPLVRANRSSRAVRPSPPRHVRQNDIGRTPFDHTKRCIGSQRIWRKSDLLKWRNGKREGWTPPDPDDRRSRRRPTTTYEQLSRYHIGYREGVHDGTLEGYRAGFHKGFVAEFTSGKADDPEWDGSEAGCWAHERASEAWGKHLRGWRRLPAFVHIRHKEREGNELVGYERGHENGHEAGYLTGSKTAQIKGVRRERSGSATQCLLSSSRRKRPG